MGLAASQARLLMLTARIHDVEYQAQMIQNAKLQLALQEDEVYRKYNEALDATTLTFTNDSGDLVPASFNNLCGISSINNGMNKNYIFRTSDDKIIVPNDVYKGFIEYNGDDPYEFALYMLGVHDHDKFIEVQGEVAKARSASGDDEIKRINERKKEILESIAGPNGLNNPAIVDCVMSGEESIDNHYTEGNDFVNDLIDEYKSLDEEYKYRLYRKDGAKSIYEGCGGNEKTFDQDKFDYYLRWGMLMSREVSWKGYVSDTDYSEDFGNNPELLNEMLKSGRITVEIVDIDSSGKLSDETTAVSSDSRLKYTNTSTIDKKALAKAEAEYEYEMKKIDKKDKKFDMDLNKLETERTALTTEYDSVKKVIQDNIERTFGIFS